MIKTLLLIIIPMLIAAIVLYRMFKGKKVTLGDEIVAYIKEQLRLEKYTDLDFETMVIKLEDHRQIFGCIFLSIYTYEGHYVQEKVFGDSKTGEIPPLEVWYSIADRLIENFLKSEKKKNG